MRETLLTDVYLDQSCLLTRLMEELLSILVPHAHTTQSITHRLIMPLSRTDKKKKKNQWRWLIRSQAQEVSARWTATVSSTRLASGSAGFLGGLRSVFGVEGSGTWQSSVAPGRGEFRTGLLHEGRRSGDAWTRSRAGPLGSGYTKKGQRVSDDVFSPLRGKIASSVFVLAYRSHGKVKSTISLFYNSTKCSLWKIFQLDDPKEKASVGQGARAEERPHSSPKSKEDFGD